MSLAAWNLIFNILEAVVIGVTVWHFHRHDKVIKDLVGILDELHQGNEDVKSLKREWGGAES